MGLSINRAHSIMSMMKARISSIFSGAPTFCLTDDQLVEEMNRQWRAAPEMAKVPEWVKSYLQGWRDAKWEYMWSTQLVWMLSVDGKLLTSKQVDALTEEENLLLGASAPASGASVGLDSNRRSPWQRVDSDQSRHVWKHYQTGEPRLDKPFNAIFLRPATNSTVIDAMTLRNTRRGIPGV